MVAGSLVVLALLGVVGPSVQTWVGTAPSGSCVGKPVYIDYLGTGIYYCNAGTWASVTPGGGGGGTPGTPLNSVQYNSAGAFAGSANLTFDGTTLGASFPKATANTAYDWAFWAVPNGSTIGYYIRRQVGGQTASGSLSTDLPRNTVSLGWDMTINSGSSAAITTMQFGGVCYLANP